MQELIIANERLKAQLSEKEKCLAHLARAEYPLPVSRERERAFKFIILKKKLEFYLK
jgi:hypothetical protein